jgi:hypothetical protein
VKFKPEKKRPVNRKGKRIYTDEVIASLRLEGKSLTNPPASLKSRVSIRAFYIAEEWNIPGFWQIDTVRYCGQTSAGQYAHTLTATDAAFGWMELRSLLNNANSWMFKALSDIKHNAPFPILEFYSDNGSECIDHATESLPFTCGRDYRKNDTCFIKQKNGAIVREYVGYDQLSGLEEQALLAAVYSPRFPLLNCFIPTQKLKSKTKGGIQRNQGLWQTVRPLPAVYRALGTPAGIQGFPLGAIRPVQPGGTSAECQLSYSEPELKACPGKPCSNARAGLVSVTFQNEAFR